MKMDIINLDGKNVGSLDLADSVFGLAERKDLLHRVVTWQLAHARQGSANTKCRGEISRTSAKLYRQKGTGNARHGSKRSNIFVGGATQFGPKPRDFGFSLNKKIRTLALKTALSSKLARKEVVVIDKAATKTHKTKDLAAQLAKLDLQSATFIVDSYDDNFDKASRNLPHIKVMPTEGANVYDILRQDKLVLTEEAVKLLEVRLVGTSAPAKAEEVKEKAPAKKPAAKKPAAKKTTAKKEAE